MKKCPFCAEQVQYAAVRCKHCHSDLNDSHKATQSPTQPHAKPDALKKSSIWMNPRTLWELKGLRVVLIVGYFFVALSIWASLPLLGLILVFVPTWLIKGQSGAKTVQGRLKDWRRHKTRVAVSGFMALMSLMLIIGSPPSHTSSIDQTFVDNQATERTPYDTSESSVKTAEEIEQDKRIVQGLEARRQENEAALARARSSVTIVEEADYSYSDCSRIGVRVTVPDDTSQALLDIVLEEMLSDYGVQDVTIWAWNDSEHSQVGRVSATRGIFERSSCD